MFSKALFKQSCKANGTMWAIITSAVCFMLACVMLISGGGAIGAVKDSIEDTIITKEIDAQMEKRAIAYYAYTNDGLACFDRTFAGNATDTLSYLVWLSARPSADAIPDPAAYQYAMGVWQAAKPVMQTEAGRAFEEAVTAWQASMPAAEDYSDPAAYMAAIGAWQEQTPATQENAVTAAYTAAVVSLRSYLEDKGTQAGSNAVVTGNEIVGSCLYTLNPNDMFHDFYAKNGEDSPADYDVLTLIAHISAGDIATYLDGEERGEYRSARAEAGSAVFLAGNFTEETNVQALLDALSSFGVTAEKYESFGYTYDSLKHTATTAVVTYRSRLAYEESLLRERYAAGEFADEAAYEAAVAAVRDSLAGEIGSSLLESLPEAVSEALREVGQADLYTLIVGSIFYKLAGLLLPIIYMIMASNNLIAGQVDSGSMAYVLSTSTPRRKVVFTQAVYLVGSLFAMFCLTTVTGCICLSIVRDDVQLTYGKLVLLNVGAFLVLFALSGLCYGTSCWFDRSKRSMAIGGGLSIFALVAAMLGLFGSQAIPSVVRLDALNYFNYTTIISLFDVISIMEGNLVFLWKLGILLVLGLIGYIVGSLRFIKKDLPL